MNEMKTETKLNEYSVIIEFAVFLTCVFIFDLELCLIPSLKDGDTTWHQLLCFIRIVDISGYAGKTSECKLELDLLLIDSS